MSKAIRTIELEHPNEAQHDFRGGRWRELQEIHALEQLSGGLTMKQLSVLVPLVEHDVRSTGRKVAFVRSRYGQHKRFPQAAYGFAES